MSCLSRFLLTESHRRKVNEDTTRSGGERKTPLVMNIQPSGELDTFVVSNTEGELQVVENTEEGVYSNFFELELDNEDPYHFILTDVLFVEGCENDWGNVSMVDKLSIKSIDNVFSYFAAYNLDCYHIITGLQGYEALLDTGILVHPSGSGPVEEMPSEDQLAEWQEQFFTIGFINERPVVLNQYLDPYVLFATHPAYLGSLTRVGDFVSVYIHSPERGMVIVRLEEADEEKDEEV